MLRSCVVCGSIQTQVFSLNMSYVLQCERSELCAPGVKKSQAPRRRGAYICWSTLGYLLHVKFMTSGILNWPLHLWKFCVPLGYIHVAVRRNTFLFK
jgi:hypothetical protein